VRNFLTTLLISQGVPMICGGDEFGRTQRGNNNAYCHDNELSWLSWEWNKYQKAQREFTSRLIEFRLKHPVFRRPKFFQGRKIRGRNIKDVMWLTPQGAELTDREWTSERLQSIAVLLCGDAGDVRDARGQSVHDDTFLLLFNASHEPVTFRLAGQKKVRWELLLDTDREQGFLDPPALCFAGREMLLVERSLRILRLSRGALEAVRSPASQPARGDGASPPDAADAHPDAL
jgi:glycogen operon protein